MGQKHGKAVYNEAAIPFINLPFAAIESLWEAFNDVADGFGITLFEFQEICAELASELGVNRVKMDDKSENLFKVLDNDSNGLIDAIEFLAALAVASGLANRDTLEFVFKCYDFDGSQELTIDEVTLAMKSTLTGLCKLSGDAPPREEELEVQAMDAFQQSGKNEAGKITLLDILKYCTENPEARSWMEFYDDPTELDLNKQEVLDAEIDYAKESEFVKRSGEMTAATDNDTFAYDNNAALTAQLESPWVKTIESLVPTEFVNERIPASAPDSKLRLEWVHGYRASDCKNNVRYASNGDICYHAARAGIIYNPIEHKQRYNLDHTEDIVSFAMHPEGQLIATGEAGENPKVVVWDTDTMKAVSIMVGFHTTAVTQLAFSNDGNKLATVGQDPNRCLAVYDWRSGSKIFSSRICNLKTLDCAFGAGDVVVACGVNHIFFWAKEGQYWTKKRGLFGKKGKLQPQLCIVPCGNKMVSGTASGYLYVWAGRNCVKTIKAHHGSVNALYYCEKGIVSGGKDMKVRMWTLSLEKGATFDMSAFGNASIRSVCLSADATRILVGTMGSEIWEISAADGADVQGGPITVGHNAGKLCGLAVHPMKPEYCTVGDDMTVRVWDIVTKHLVKMTKLDTPARAVGYAPDGDFLVVGLGGDEDATGLSKKDGAFLILNEADLTTVYEAKDGKAAILDAKFAPNGDALALSCADKQIYFYDTSEEYDKLGQATRAKAAVTNFDFSDDSGWIQATCSDGELMFFNSKGLFQSNLNAVKDTPWATQNCPYSWPTFGTWSRHADGSATTTSDRSESETILVAGDNQGNVKLYRYPSAAKAALSHSYKGHSANVSKVRFANSDAHMISIGADDRCIFQWAHVEDDDEEEADMVDEEESDDYAKELLDGDELDRTEAIAAATDECANLSLKLELNSTADDMKALKPWVEEAVAPSFKVASNTNTVDSSKQLEFIHGFRAQDVRQNLKYNSAGDMVYCAANVGVIFSKASMSQRFNCHHTDEVISLAMSPDKRYVATGQIGPVPTIVVWDSVTGETVKVLSGFHKRSVSQLEFSSDGKLLASAGNDDNHSIAVYDWMAGVIKCSTFGGMRKVLGLAFCPGEKLLQVGLKHITFWEIEGKNMLYKKALIGRKGKLQGFLCAVFLNTGGEFGTPSFLPIVGTADGHMYLFEDDQLTKSIKAHESFVNTLVATKSGLLASGAKDGLVKLWRWAEDELENTHTFDVRDLKSSLVTRVRSLDVDEEGGRLLVGTQASEIFEMSIIDGSNVNGTGPLVKGHHKGEVWGLTTHPTKPNYATLGDDGVLNLWDATTFKSFKYLKMDTGGRAIAYDTTGDLLAVGLGKPGTKKAGKKDGSFIIFDSTKLSQIHEGRDSNECIMDIKFSPDNKTLAVGSFDTNVYLYNAQDGYSKRAVIKCAGSWVTHIDFTVDSQYLQISDGAHSLVFAECTNGVQIPTPASLKDATYSTVTTPLGWGVKGFWPKNIKEEVDVVGCARSKDAHEVASMDNFGRLCVWRYPSHAENPGRLAYRGHSIGGGNVDYTAGDQAMVSVGAKDRCIFQWKHIPEGKKDSGDEAGDSGDDSELELDGGMGGATPIVLDGGVLAEAFVGIKPWNKTMNPPSTLEMENTAVPDYDVELDYVHGCRIEDTRNTIRYNMQGEIVYPAAAVGVIYRPSDRSQQFCLGGHKNDIVSLAVSDCGRYIATGDVGLEVKVCVWDAQTGKLVRTMEKVHKRGVACMAFSPDGRFLCSVGHDENHTTCVYTTMNGEWNDGHRIATEKGDRAKVMFVMFCGEENFPLMVGSVKRAQFVELEAGHTLNRRRGKFGHRKKIQPLLCGAMMKGETESVIITGTANGQLYSWKKQDSGEHKVNMSVSGHTGAVYSVCAGGMGVVSGGKDGLIIVWSGDLIKQRTYNIMDIKEISKTPYSCVIHSLHSDQSFSKILVGCKGGEIYEIAKDSGRMILQNEGHSMKELWGISMHPKNEDLFATTGDDAVVRIWSIKNREVLRKMTLDSASRAVAWSPDGKQLCVGLGGDSAMMVKDGTFLIVDSNKMEVVHEDRKSKMWLTDIKFSPEGGSIGMSSQDGRVYIHDSASYELKIVTAKIPTPIVMFDWDDKGEHLQCTTPDWRLLFFTAEDGKQVTSNAKLRDSVWDTQTCTLGWNVQGVWPKEDLTQAQVNVGAVHRANKKKILAAGSDDGSVKIYHFPTQIKDMGSLEAVGGSNFLSKVRFNLSDDVLLTMGAQNRVVMQYKMKSNGLINVNK
ncbi:hypothetical protein TrLO_g13994 [Triparma laevis f. longispina]|uniref:EF-hand domain-containing protein n=1 Tax=Triparma laevis f. longispina TaxID=1714387 RepID=A0A9W7ATM1_9STRA|nr:hypothetical protein TrLO_g13994 [Triparma laevis f. longispina]